MCTCGCFLDGGIRKALSEKALCGGRRVGGGGVTGCGGRWELKHVPSLPSHWGDLLDPFVSRVGSCSLVGMAMKIWDTLLRETEVLLSLRVGGFSGEVEKPQHWGLTFGSNGLRTFGEVSSPTWLPFLPEIWMLDWVILNSPSSADGLWALWEQKLELHFPVWERPINMDLLTRMFLGKNERMNWSYTWLAPPGVQRSRAQTLDISSSPDLTCTMPLARREPLQHMTNRESSMEMSISQWMPRWGALPRCS